MDIVIATRNNDKLREIKALFKDLSVKIFSLKDYAAIPKIEETGNTFKENALIKASKTAKLTGKLTLADDSGLEVKILNGQPGVYSARFAGENVTYRDNNLKLLKLLEGVPPSGRGARFVCSVVIVEPGGRIIVIEKYCQGAIGFKPKGSFGFGYDPLFIPRGYKKSFAELKPQIKNRLSHRGRAFKEVKAVLLRHFFKKNLLKVFTEGRFSLI